MRVLLINQFFWPDSAATSQLLTDLARAMAENGHEVYAISADGGYAVAADDAPPPVSIHRVRSLPFGRGWLGRVLSYASFYVSAAWKGLTLPRPDLVLTLTTPPLLSLLGTAIHSLRGSRHFIWEMDMYPDVAVDLGYLRSGGLVDRVTGWLADFARHRADGIIALGECMKDRLVARGIPAAKIDIADNWADGTSIRPQPRPGDASELVVLYSGNLGLAHDLDTVTGALRHLRPFPEVRFLFVGSGGRRQELARFVASEGISAVEMRPYVQRTSLGESLSAGDIGLVTQHEAVCGSVVPSKVYGLLAAGRPILFVGPAAATPARIIRRFGCGWHVPVGDSSGLAELLLHLNQHRDEVTAAGARARQAHLRHFDLPLGVAHLCNLLGLAPVPTHNPQLAYTASEA